MDSPLPSGRGDQEVCGSGVRWAGLSVWFFHGWVGLMPRYRTVTQQLMPPKGLKTVTADPGSAIHLPSTTKRYS